jgi:hypothetical protein
MIRKTALAITVAVFLCIQGTDASSHRSNASNAGFRVQSQLSVEKIKSNGRTNGITQKQQVPPELALRGGVANTVTNAIAGSVALALIEKAVKTGLARAKINFPGQLAACMALFVSLLGIEAVSPSLANSIFNALSPGSALLAKWLPVFFVPGLVLLPLSKPIGGTLEVSRTIGFRAVIVPSYTT